ncbi:hypothetical protein KI659_06125 [Litoribacter alkaliphilus]|uniref:Uncharacterized protein n=1 Tax=Litoribacter ruber TaxID=702568 RepID=A0AAP2CFF4_9BACT|nr:hypothetical protein [Litoribacter alkaliphilus]MBS9523591.1 hypothetical protein [Litoribacter alkaliphilus]
MYKVVFAILAFMAVSISAFSQGLNQNAYKRWTEIGVADFESQLDGLQAMPQIYSKARGVTIFAAINNVNQRAMRKLKVEAAMLGADVVYISNNYQKGVQFYSPVQVAYTATPYVKEPVTVNKAKEMAQGNTFQPRTKTRYNRNKFGPTTDSMLHAQQPMTLDEPYEENGFVFIDVNLTGLKRPYRIVRITDYQIILARIIVPDKVIENYELVVLDSEN